MTVLRDDTVVISGGRRIPLPNVPPEKGWTGLLWGQDTKTSQRFKYYH